MRSNYKRIGDYIRLVDNRNDGHSVKTLLGLSISKKFIPSVANIIGTDMENYKIIRKNQFACSIMQVRRDKKMPVALLKENDEAIISQAYPIFEVNDTKQLLPEYLMMWFSRQEFDREACFYAIGGVRGSLEWEDFCDMKFPLISLSNQKEIVKEYHTIVDRINLNNQLVQKLEETAQAIYNQWFVDFEFPDEKEKPYKSNGGEMEWNEELEMEVPKGWETGCLGDFVDVINGYAFSSSDFKQQGTLRIIKIGNITPPYVDLQDVQFYKGELTNGINKCIAEKGDILISMTGSHETQISSAVGKVAKYIDAEASLLNQRVGKLKPLPGHSCKEFVYQRLLQKEAKKELLGGATGSANQANISPAAIKAVSVIKPAKVILQEFEKLINPINESIILYNNQSKKLEDLKGLLLSKLATIEN